MGMRRITSTNTHQNGAKGGGGYGPHAPKVWWVVVACETRRRERSEWWVDRVCDKNKKSKKKSVVTKKKFFTFFLQKWSRRASNFEASWKAPRAAF
jgi:hypothetical protein